MTDVKLVFEYSVKGRRAFDELKAEVPVKTAAELIPDRYLRKEDAQLPELSEVDVIRHFTGLSKRNHGVDSGFYPLGSCTMKYNPKINEEAANLPGFSKVHPYQPESTVQGCIELIYKMQIMLSEITGM
ncbi:MAG: aminomethyl-transferring glycine dehydrogenase subunit GcvPB, partial [Eubacteriales bacterium]|nr:aminomethyl-transferring glycine dehydrogenase subunit GcvPB [Eubacteriales bacterium]